MPIKIRQSAPQTVQEILPLPQELVPEIPPDLLARFPNLEGWYDRVKSNERKLFAALQDSNRTVSTTVGSVKKKADVLGVELVQLFDEFEDAAGNLSGKYTLQVVAGNVVTGMILTSSTGPGTPISSVKFQADQFQIWNGSSGQAVFDLNGSDVRISGWTLGATTLTGGNATLDSAGQLILGTSNNVAVISASDSTYRIWVGNAAAGSAAFSVTKAGVMSATGATISGTVTASSGTIGGFALSSTTLSATNISISSSTASISVSSGSTAVTMSNSGLTLGAGSTNGSATGSGISFTNVAGQLAGFGVGGFYIKASTGNPTLTLQVGATTDTLELVSSSGSPVLSCANVRFGTRTAIGAETITGFITILDAGGTSRKLAVVS